MPSFAGARERYRPLLRALAGTGIAFAAVWTWLTFLPLTRWSEWSTPLGGMQDSVAVHVISALEALVLSSGTRLLLLGPFDAFIAIVLVGSLLALVVIIPLGSILVFRALAKITGGRRLSYPDERSALVLYGSLAAALFLFGFSLGLGLLVPALFAWSAILAPSVGATQSVALLEFVSAALLIPALIGLSFELPIIAVGLARAGIASSGRMRKHWRVELFGCYALAFLISPGVGGGILELGLGSAFAALLGLAYLLVRRAERKRPSSGARITALVRDHD